MKVGVVDYGGGNIRSLVKALESLGVNPEMLDSPEKFAACELLVFPGQGSFGDCMRKLKEHDLVTPLKSWLAAERPFFGICVGYQLLFKSSEESPGEPGLGVFEGTVQRFPEAGIKIPHMGWNSAQLRTPESSPWQGLGPDPYFYYVHSYFPVPADTSLIAAETEYGSRFAAAVQRGPIVATQFHPEKSQKAGMRLLENFLRDNGAL